MAVKLVKKTTSYSNSVGNYMINYSIAQSNEEKAEKIFAEIKAGEIRVGSLFANVDGSLNLNFNAGIYTEDKATIFSTCLTDITSIFDELNKE